MVRLTNGRVYRTWALVTRGGRGRHQLVDVRAERDVPYAVLQWSGREGYEWASSRVRLDAALLRELKWAEVDLLYTGRIEAPARMPLPALIEPAAPSCEDEARALRAARQGPEQL
jgi:hypothetical protein